MSISAPNAAEVGHFVPQQTPLAMSHPHPSIPGPAFSSPCAAFFTNAVDTPICISRPFETSQENPATYVLATPALGSTCSAGSESAPINLCPGMSTRLPGCVASLVSCYSGRQPSQQEIMPLPPGLLVTQPISFPHTVPIVANPQHGTATVLSCRPPARG
ncbi:unnamed protein product [Protopolystoma xenopodis]|uniref:Uncharacterized protein n=1 Tax=Protopolystoma xenopodis TaxID=117903 RepID=A0A3S5CM44_9PLAT|nr:unnamed protein product [Protopolystoma xenopodis]